MHYDVIEHTVDAFLVVQLLRDATFKTAPSGANEGCENGPAEYVFKSRKQVSHGLPNGSGYS